MLRLGQGSVGSCCERSSRPHWVKNSKRALAAHRAVTASSGSVSVLDAPSSSRTSTSYPALPSGSAVARISRALRIKRDQAELLLQQCPSLTSVPITAAKQQIRAMADSLACEPLQVVELLSKRPMLWSMQAPELGQKVAALQAQLHAPDLVGLVCVAPDVLLQDSSNVSQQLKALATLLDVRASHARRIVFREPLLLVRPTQKLQDVLDLFTNELGMESQQAREYLAKHCNFLTMSRSCLAEKATTLGQLLRLPMAGVGALVTLEPLLLERSAGALRQRHTELAAVLPPDKLRAVLRKSPGLLLRSTKLVKAKVSALAEILGCSAEQALALACERPALLTKSRATLRTSYAALSIWAMKPEEKLALVQAYPVLLQISPTEVHGRCRWLRQLMLSSGYFHVALRRMPKEQLARIIVRLCIGWSRLHYLVDSQKVGTITIMDAVQTPLEKFLARFPDYEPWLRVKRKQLSSRVPWAVPGAVQGVRHIKAKAAGGSSKGAGKPATAGAKGASPKASEQQQQQQQQQQQAQADAAAASSPPDAPADVVPVVEEARTVFVGKVALNKPRRVVVSADPPAAAAGQNTAVAAKTPLFGKAS